MRHRSLVPALLLTALGLPLARGAETIPLASLDLAPMTQEYGRPAVDLSVGGHPLRIAGHEFVRGLGTHAASQLTVRVDRHALRFHARVGVDDEGPGGTVEFRVVGDGRTLWSSGVLRAGQPAKEVDVPLAGVGLLVLETDATADGNKDDHADWAEAELVMEDGAKPVTVADPEAERDAGAGERTPSHAQYFTWINNTNEGATEAQTLTNLAFFRWLRDEYGMQLDIYAWDAGNLDVPRGYGTTDSARFKAQYPRGWRPIADAAGALGCRLGLWGGPDGFGDTPEQAAARIALMSGLCRDYRMAEFKFDGVCGQLRPDKQDYFVQMMQACRKFSPDLVLLNHRLPLGKGLRYATTFLFEGVETYIDVHMANSGTATHHRAGALARGLPPRLTRLTEDHGVCISSCLDAWDDDLVLQAFNRSLILAPEIYGNPWFLRDDEYPKLARIYNLHRRWRDVLTQGVVLPEADYGPHAVARGDAGTRVVTLRNLGWEPRTYQVELDEAIGLTAPGAVTVRLFHPHERILGTQAHGGTVPVTVAPFSVALLLATTAPCAEPGVSGCDAEVVRDVPGKPLVLRLLGLPGTTATATFAPGRVPARSATIDGQPLPGFAAGQPVMVTFPGAPLAQPSHRRLAELAPCAVPADAQALYEATCFAADNDALEARSLRRSGPTLVPQVQAARDAFFDQELFAKRGCWDRLLFDGVRDTGLVQGGRLPGNADGAPELRVDLGAPTVAERFALELAGGTTSGQAEGSADLLSWTALPTTVTAQAVTITPPAGLALRYLRLPRGSMHLCEFTGVLGGKPLPRTGWRASELFESYSRRTATAAWTATVTLGHEAPGSYLCIALEGEHGVDGAWAAARLAGRPLGCPDRAPSFASNVWEAPLRQAGSNCTYYLPVTADMAGKPLDLVVLTLANGKNAYKPVAWITSREPMVGRVVVVE